MANEREPELSRRDFVQGAVSGAASRQSRWGCLPPTVE